MLSLPDVVLSSTGLKYFGEIRIEENGAAAALGSLCKRNC